MKAKKQKIIHKLKSRLGHHVTLVVVPHKVNNYRPYLVRRYGLIGVVLLVFVVQLLPLYTNNGAVLGESASLSTGALLEATNNERQKNQLSLLRADERLNKAALLKAEDMFRQQYWAHTAPDGTTPWQWFDKAEYKYAYAGENLAKNFHSSDAVTLAWMGSESHRANILGGKYTNVGFAIVDGMLKGEEVTLVVALYGTPATNIMGANFPVTHVPLLDEPINGVTRLGMAIQSMSPAVLGTAALLGVVAVTALSAHFYRKRLPRALRESWYRHHGIAKAGGVLGLLLIVVAMYSGGQI